MFQVLWKEGMGWDEELAVEKVDIWKKIEADLLELPDMKVQRCIGNDHCQLLYTKEGVTTNLIFSKSRVAPEKVVTLPPLKLLAVLIGIRCLNFIRKHWKYPVEREIRVD